jgi:hypothetical protein
MKCQCDRPGSDHQPNECPCNAEWIVRRNGRDLRVCGMCCGLGNDSNVRKIDEAQEPTQIKLWP